MLTQCELQAPLKPLWHCRVVSGGDDGWLMWALISQNALLQPKPKVPQIYLESHILCFSWISLNRTEPHPGSRSVSGVWAWCWELELLCQSRLDEAAATQRAVWPSPPPALFHLTAQTNELYNHVLWMKVKPENQPRSLSCERRRFSSHPPSKKKKGVWGWATYRRCDMLSCDPATVEYVR